MSKPPLPPKLLKREPGYPKLYTGGLLFFAAGVALLAATRLLWLSSFPGFHYDEAWAANFAHQIAATPGFWPRQAMSPYTSAWGHYLTALFFHFFGTRLFVYRASGALLVLLGATSTSAALLKMGEKKAAFTLPWLWALSPALIANERFVIDLTSVHVFALGLFLLGMSFFYRDQRSRLAVLLTVMAAVIGITSHLLFIGVALAAVAALIFGPGPRQPSTEITLAILTGGLCAILFFIRVYLLIPEKDKAAALIAVTSVTMLFGVSASLKSRLRHTLTFFPPRLIAPLVFWTLLTPSLFFLVFFIEGSWGIRFFTGEMAHPWLAGSALIGPVAILIFGRTFVRTLPRGFLLFTGFTLILTAALAVKPAPRYFEIPLILMLVILAWLLGRLSRSLYWACFLLYGITAGGPLVFNYVDPLLTREWPKQLSYQLLFFRDNTSDTLSKQRLVKTLAAHGCASAEVTTTDPRLGEELRFLALGDWQIASSQTQCDLGKKLRVELGNGSRSADAADATQVSDAFEPFKISAE